ncbi:MAG: 6-carboxytetrahydropterin synthase [Campylobacterota bacterium]|nr:6-carboxytetrahydropterin synthase [Campylobacterota bacterium]
MKWQISKQFDFCYGHRVWSQELNPDYSLDACLMCRHLHGHQGKILVHLESDSLENGMVTDFKHLNWFKKFLDDVIDHKFIIDINDPLFDTLLPHYTNNSNDNFHKMKENYKIPNLTIIKDEPLHIHEMYQGYIIVDFVPTSENLSAWLLEIVQEKMSKIGVRVSHLEYFETPKSRSVVYSD